MSNLIATFGLERAIPEINRQLMREIHGYDPERRKETLLKAKRHFRTLKTYGGETQLELYRNSLKQAKENPYTTDYFFVLDIAKEAARLSYVASLHQIVGAL